MVPNTYKKVSLLSLLILNSSLSAIEEQTSAELVATAEQQSTLLTEGLCQEEQAVVKTQISALPKRVREQFMAAWKEHKKGMVGSATGLGLGLIGLVALFARKTGKRYHTNDQNLVPSPAMTPPAVVTSPFAHGLIRSKSAKNLFGSRPTIRRSHSMNNLDPNSVELLSRGLATIETEIGMKKERERQAAREKAHEEAEHEARIQMYPHAAAQRLVRSTSSPYLRDQASGHVTAALKVVTQHTPSPAEVPVALAAPTPADIDKIIADFKTEKRITDFNNSSRRDCAQRIGEYLEKHKIQLALTFASTITKAKTANITDSEFNLLVQEAKKACPIPPTTIFIEEDGDKVVSEPLYVETGHHVSESTPFDSATAVPLPTTPPASPTALMTPTAEGAGTHAARRASSASESPGAATSADAASQDTPSVAVDRPATKVPTSDTVTSPAIEDEIDKILSQWKIDRNLKALNREYRAQFVNYLANNSEKLGIIGIEKNESMQNIIRKPKKKLSEEEYDNFIAQAKALISQAKAKYIRTSA